jgi:hypothetical protein
LRRMGTDARAWQAEQYQKLRTAIEQSRLSPSSALSQALAIHASVQQVTMSVCASAPHLPHPPPHPPPTHTHTQRGWVRGLLM